MPFYFRKSVSLGSGMRMNLSKSGIGFSFGRRGARVSTGPRGTYVNIGAGGVHYRQKIGGSTGHVSPTPAPDPNAFSFQAGTPIPNASAKQLVDSTSSATLEQLNATIRQPAYAQSIAFAGAVIGVALGTLHPVLFFAVGGFGLYLASIANQWDKERRTYRLDFNLDEAARHQWIAMNTAFVALAKTKALWRITNVDFHADWKRNAGANALMDRVRAYLAQNDATFISSNLKPYGLHIGNQYLSFFPDRVYVYEGRTYGAVEYSGLTVTAADTRFIEHDGVPSDANVVGSTWQYVNKDGSPDRRFNDNHEIPIANYGVLEFQSNNGLHIIMQVSSPHAAYEFTNLYQQSMMVATGSYAHRQSGGTQQPPRNQQQRPAAPPRTPPSIPDCFRVMGLTIDCTKEEASAKYRQLANSYHPDRVHHLAPEFQKLAHQKMTEINNAFANLRRLRGW